MFEKKERERKSCDICSSPLEGGYKYAAKYTERLDSIVCLSCAENVPVDERPFINALVDASSN